MCINRDGNIILKFIKIQYFEWSIPVLVIRWCHDNCCCNCKIAVKKWCMGFLVGRWRLDRIVIIDIFTHLVDVQNCNALYQMYVPGSHIMQSQYLCWKLSDWMQILPDRMISQNSQRISVALITTWAKHRCAMPHTIHTIKEARPCRLCLHKIGKSQIKYKESNLLQQDSIFVLFTTFSNECSAFWCGHQSHQWDFVTAYKRIQLVTSKHTFLTMSNYKL